MSPRDALRVVRARRQLASGEARAIRVQSGLLLHEMAEALEVSVPTVSKWERGERTPKADHALAYAGLIDELSRIVEGAA